MIEALKKSVESEIDILREMSVFVRRIETANPVEKKMLSEGMSALTAEMKSINSSIPELLRDIVSSKTEPSKPSEKLNQPGMKKGAAAGEMIPRIERRDEYLKELEIGEDIIKKLKSSRSRNEEKPEEFQKARGYLRLSNKIFLGTATKLVKKGYFGDLPSDIRKANLDVLFEAYVAMMLFSAFIAFFAGIFITLVLFAMGFGVLKIVWVPLVAPILVFLALIYYPSAEKRSISNKVDEELPFAVIHMSSISGSGIEPTEIFRIIGLSRDYPALRKEIRKVLNQINIYGYDLVTALNNVSKNTANVKLAELFSGLSTTINSGGGLSDFFQKRADTLLVSYKLEKEKSIKVAETFMDIYISVVIAAPMILMLMLVMISISGIQIGFTPYQLTSMTIGGVALINLIFLGYLQTKQT